ncbi:hypothetical protein BO94DRAFT_323499 [Aspergillus sclerotioniger CBS 115572]|uniref:Uncharacterized protein n=1 Tax=Aspergillus sclerotioniger CBS 115572 TaxID=1450535 RepID=A0A317X952_9EURO|nr:hypothetical protein BO94DRAFT_323499 [Aspergillus sclerotioniger CBS 115572]PWY94182.1 hypothetical protein BO94DRAFT_323499 [Aspergillus sclerotioniger CBS 115572]
MSSFHALSRWCSGWGIPFTISGRQALTFLFFSFSFSFSRGLRSNYCPFFSVGRSDTPSCMYVMVFFLVSLFPFILIPRACYTEQLPRYFRWIDCICIAQRHTQDSAAMVWLISFRFHPHVNDSAEFMWHIPSTYIIFTYIIFIYIIFNYHNTHGHFRIISTIHSSVLVDR